MNLIKLFSKKKRYKFIYGGCRGVISILLCIAMLPFLSVTAFMINAIKYQSEIKTLRELISLAQQSTLTDYDEYLYSRFGLLALSQKNSTLSKYPYYVDTLTGNVSTLMGGSVSLESNTWAKGMSGSELENIDVLLEQIYEYSETNVLFAVGSDAAGSIVDQIKEKLSSTLGESEKYKKLEKISDSVEKATKAIDAFNDIVKDVNKLVEYGNTVTEFLNNYHNAYSDFKNVIDNNYDKYIAAMDAYSQAQKDQAQAETTYGQLNAKLNEMAKTDPGYAQVKKNCDSAKASFEEAKKTTQEAKTLADTYYNNLKTGYESYVSSLNNAGLNKALESAKEIFEHDSSGEDFFDKMKKHIKKLKDAVTKKVETPEKEQTTTELVDAMFKTIVEEMDKSLSEASIEAWKNSNIKNAVDDLYIGMGTDFVTFLSSYAGEKKLNEQYAIADYTIFLDESQTFKGFGSENGLLDKLYKAFNDDTDKKSFSDMINNIKNSVYSIVHLETFYNPSLDGIVKEEYLYVNEAPSSAAELVNAVNDLIDAGEDIKEAFESEDFFEGLSKLVEGIKNILDAVASLIKAIVALIEEAFLMLTGFIGNDLESMYKCYILSQYMTRNFPCRTCSDDGGKPSGSSMTGYSYSDIKVKGAGALEDSVTGDFLSLIDAIGKMKDSDKADDMFRAAELEYLIAGSRSEIANQINVFMLLYMVRLIMNLAPVLTSPSVESEAAASTIAAPLIYVYHVLMEPMCDTIILVNAPAGDGNNALPLLKNSNSLYSEIAGDGIIVFGKDIITVCTNNDKVKGSMETLYKDLNKDFKMDDKFTNLGKSMTIASDKGYIYMNYQDYLSLFLMMKLLSSTYRSDISNRLEKLIELEARAYYKDTIKNYGLSKAYTVLETNTTAKFNGLIGSDLMDSAYTLKFTAYKGY